MWEYKGDLSRITYKNTHMRIMVSPLILSHTVDAATVVSYRFTDLTSSRRFACSISGNIYV